MHIGIVMLVVMLEGIEDRTRLLCRRRIVKINQGSAVHLFAEDREVLAKRIPIEGVARDFVHSLICDATGNAPTHLREVVARRVVSALQDFGESRWSLASTKI